MEKSGWAGGGLVDLRGKLVPLRRSSQIYFFALPDFSRSPTFRITPLSAPNLFKKGRRDYLVRRRMASTPSTSSSSTPTASSGKPVSIVFVCLGNICRSPMAEAVFQHLVKSRPSSVARDQLISRIDSAGTGAYHVGHSPDPRTMSTLEVNGITTYTHRARKIVPADFTAFDYILAMDVENLMYLQEAKEKILTRGKLREDQLGRVMLFGDFGGEEGEEVVDPYYGEQDGFDIAYKQMVRFSEGLLRRIEDGVPAAGAETT